MERGQKNMILVELLQELHGLAKIQFRHVSIFSSEIKKFTFLADLSNLGRWWHG